MTDSHNDSHAKTPVEAAVEHAMETFVYAPIGLLFEGSSILPQLVEKGRNQVTMARMLGKFAVEQGRTEATKAASKLQDQAAGVLDLIGSSLAPGGNGGAASATPAPRPAPRRSPSRSGAAAGAARAAARQVAGAVTVDETEPVEAPRSGDASTLAIPDYDGLSASHVVNRLAGLSAAELEAVRAYEAEHRGRKTILSKVAQLQSA